MRAVANRSLLAQARSDLRTCDRTWLQLHAAEGVPNQQTACCLTQPRQYRCIARGLLWARSRACLQGRLAARRLALVAMPVPTLTAPWPHLVTARAAAARLCGLARGRVVGAHAVAAEFNTHAYDGVRAGGVLFGPARLANRGHAGLVIRWESRLSGWKLWRAGASNSCPVPRVARSAHAWHAAQATRSPSATRAVRPLAYGVARACVAVPGGRLRLANFVYRPTKRRREVHVRGATVCRFPVSSCSGLGADPRVVCLHPRQTRRGHAELRMLAYRHVPLSLRARKRMCRRVRVVRPAGATPGARGSSVRHFSREASHTGQDACMHTRDLEDARARRASFAGISRSCMRPASRRATGAPVRPYRHQTPSV